MPVLGNRGVVAPREIQRAAARPAPPVRSLPAPSRPMVYAPAPANPWQGVPSSHPFAQAQHQAAQHVAQAQRALPKWQTPAIPRLANPTPGQARLALQEAHRAQERNIGPNPSRQHELAYQREVMSDPRQAAFVQSVAHYLLALRGHEQGQLQQTFPLAGTAPRAKWSGANLLDQANAEVGRGGGQRPDIVQEARQQAEASSRNFQREGAQELAQAKHWKVDPLGLGTIDLTDVATSLANVHVPGLSGIPGKLVNEAIDLPGQTFLSGAEAGGAARSAIEGRPGEAEALGKGVLHTFEHPIESVKQAPLATALMFGGAEAAAGGALGKLARAGALGDRAAELAATARPDLNLYGGEKLTNRTYNADPLRKSLQVLYERKIAPATGGGDATQALGWRLRRNMAGGALKTGAVDVMRGAGEVTRRATVQGTLHAADQAVKDLPAHARDILPLVGERILAAPHTFAIDLTKRLQVLKQHEGDLTGQALADNRANQQRIVAVQHDSQLMSNPRPLFDAAEQLRQLQSPTTRMRLHGGQMEPEQLRAALFGYAIEHMGAKHFTVAEHAAAEKAALGRIKGIEQRIADAPKALARAESTVGLAKAKERITGAIDLANRPSSAGERDAAIAAVNRLKASSGIRDLREVPSLADAQRALGDLQRSHASMHSELEAATHDRLRVSGRQAQGVLDHEALRNTELHARRNVQEQEVRVARAQKWHDQITGQQRSARARERRGATPAESQRLEAARGRLRGEHEALRLLKSEHRDAKGLLGESKLPEIQAGLRGRDGELLTNETILAHMKDRGVSPPMFIRHQPGVGGARSFYRSTLRQPALERFNRTGEAVRKGQVEQSWATLRGTLGEHASLAAQLAVRRRELNRIGIGQYDTPHEAELAAENFHTTPEGKRVEGANLGKLQVTHIGSGQIVKKGHIHPVAAEHVLQQFGLDTHAPFKESELGRYTLIPKSVGERMAKHDAALHATSDVGRALQAYQQAFRHAKLNTSVPHIAGVAQEQLIRALAESVNPVKWGINWAVGHKYDAALKQLAELDKHGFLASDHGPLGERFREIQAATAARSGVVSSQRVNDVVRKGEQMQETSVPGRVARAAAGSAPFRAAMKPWLGWRHGVEGSLGALERSAHTMHLGKALRDGGFVPSLRETLRMQEQAMKDHIAGTMTPQKADALARRVDDTMGNWTHQTPLVRQLVGKVAPFGLWYLNSLRWLYRLPVTHPVKAAIAASLYQATRTKRNAEGQGFDAPHPVPSFLQGTIPVNLPLVGHVKAAPSYYTPGGALGAQVGETAAEQLFPGGSSIYAALRRQSPLSGEKLKDAQGHEISATSGLLNTLAEVIAGPTPLSTQAQTLMQGGGKPYGTANLLTDIGEKLGGPSQVKPGTRHSLPEVLGKMFSPTRIIRPSKAEAEAQASDVPLSPEMAQRVRAAEAAAEGTGGGAPQAQGPAQAAELRRRIKEAEAAAEAAGR